MDHHKRSIGTDAHYPIGRAETHGASLGMTDENVDGAGSGVVFTIIEPSYGRIVRANLPLIGGLGDAPLFICHGGWCNFGLYHGQIVLFQNGLDFGQLPLLGQRGVVHGEIGQVGCNVERCLIHKMETQLVNLMCNPFDNPLFRNKFEPGKQPGAVDFSPPRMTQRNRFNVKGDTSDVGGEEKVDKECTGCCHQESHEPHADTVADTNRVNGIANGT